MGDGSGEFLHHGGNASDELVGFASSNVERRNNADDVARGHREEHTELQAQSQTLMCRAIEHNTDHEAASAHFHKSGHAL